LVEPKHGGRRLRPQAALGSGTLQQRNNLAFPSRATANANHADGANTI
jgi:hypothetical protein